MQWKIDTKEILLSQVRMTCVVVFSHFDSRPRVTEYINSYMQQVRRRVQFLPGIDDHIFAGP